jgi:hypothetical protein
MKWRSNAGSSTMPSTTHRQHHRAVSFHGDCKAVRWAASFKIFGIDMYDNKVKGPNWLEGGE